MRFGPLSTCVILALVIAPIARPVSAHIVPIPPSLCGFQPVELRTLPTGLSGSAQTAGPADAMRILYDASTSMIQLCSVDPQDSTRCGSAVPRPFAFGAAAGTIAFPALFEGSMLSSGDVTIANIPVTITLGGSTATVPVTLTTGLAVVDGVVVQGTPLQGLASFQLVGALAGDSLPPPATGSSLLMTLSCQPRPVPDKDQFSGPLQLASMRGQITTTQVSLQATASVAQLSLADLAAGPMLVAVNADSTLVASGVIGNLQLRGKRKLVGTSDDGHATVTVRQPSATRLVLSVRLGNVTLPAEAGGVPVLVDVTLDGSGGIGRGEQLFRATHNGRRLTPSR